MIVIIVIIVISGVRQLAMSNASPGVYMIIIMIILTVLTLRQSV